MFVAVLLNVSFSSGRRRGCILTLCPYFPPVHPYHSVLLRSSHSQKKGSIRRRRETPLTSHSLQPGASVELQFSPVWVTLSFLYRGMRHGRCVIPWGPMSGPCQPGVVQKTAAVLGGKPSVFSQPVMSSQIIQSLKIITHWDSPGWKSRKWDLSGFLGHWEVSFSAGCFWFGQRTWEIGKDPFRSSSWMPLSVNCWAEANALFYVFNSGRTSPLPQQPVSADSCSWESFMWEPGRSDSGQQLLDPVRDWTWGRPCRVTTELKAQGTSLPMQIFK